MRKKKKSSLRSASERMQRASNRVRRWTLEILDFSMSIGDRSSFTTSRIASDCSCRTSKDEPPNAIASRASSSNDFVITLYNQKTELDEVYQIDSLTGLTNLLENSVGSHEYAFDSTSIPPLSLEASPIWPSKLSITVFLAVLILSYIDSSILPLAHSLAMHLNYPVGTYEFSH